MRVHETVLIDRPIEDVFEYLLKYENESKWQSSVEEARLTSDGPVDLGTTGLEVRIIFGLRIETTWILTEYEPPHRATCESTSGPIGYILTYSLEDSDGGTIFSYQIDSDPRGFFKLFKLLPKGLSLRALRADLATLKSILERRQSG